MIIDADVHLSPPPVQGDMITVESLLEVMDRAGVDKAVTWLQPPYRKEIDAANAYIHKAMERYPERVLGFGWADPNLGVEAAKDMVKRCVYEYGMFGVKLNGAQNSFFIDDPKLSLPVIEEVAKTGKLLAFHVGADAYEHTHPFRVAKIAAMYPETQILMVHMGGVGLPELAPSAVEFAEEHKNLTLIGSVVSPKAILSAIKRLGPERVCFGSDTPFQLMHVELAKYRALLGDQLSEKEQDLIMGGNIVRLFQLEG